MLIIWQLSKIINVDKVVKPEIDMVLHFNHILFADEVIVSLLCCENNGS